MRERTSMKDYKKEIIDEAQKQCENKQFYRINILNHRSYINEGKRKSDVLAEWLWKMSAVDEKELLLKNSTIDSDNPKTEKWTEGPIHKACDIEIKDTGRDEENIAKRMMIEESIIDYQVPIYRVNHSSEGKVDLILRDNIYVIIGELKDEDSEETLLRAMVEVRTYQLKIENNKIIKERFERCYQRKEIKAAVLMFEDTRPWKDFEMTKNKEMKYLYELAEKWGIMFYKITKKDKDKPIKDANFIIERVF